jgi:hypothetical protein
MVMQLNPELTVLHKKLLANWSAWTATRSMSSSTFIDEVRINFHKFDKKIKKRILLSLLSVDQTKLRECENSIIKLLELAGQDESSDQVIDVIPTSLILIFFFMVYLSSF